MSFDRIVGYDSELLSRIGVVGMGGRFLGIVSACLGVAIFSPVEDAVAEEKSGVRTKLMVEKDLSSFFALENSAASDEGQAELVALMTLLEEETETAHETKINADFVPGIETVLHGADLEALGIRTVFEALSLVPGINTSMAPTGQPIPVIRGVGCLNPGNIKILVDSVSTNQTDSGASAAMLSMPIELVDRINIIRGPGSALYGEYAYAGVIDIITKSNEKRVFVGGAQYETWGGGVNYAWSNPDRDAHFSANVITYSADGANIDSGKDYLYAIGMGGISNAPALTNETLGHIIGTMKFAYRDFSAKFYYTKGYTGDFFGYQTLPPERQGHKNLKAFQTGLQLKQEMALAENLEGTVALTGTISSWELFDDVVFPAGYYTDRYYYPDGMRMNGHYEEHRLDGMAHVRWNGWNKHALLVGLEYAQVDTSDGWLETNFDPETQAPLATFQRDTGFGSLDTLPSRTVFSAVVQDQYQVIDTLALTAALRYDDYDDIGSSVTPRLAAVWRPSSNHIFKFQYAKAFRPPTFQEMYASLNPLELPNENVEPEDVTTYELGYIYKRQSTVARVTLFHTKLDNMILAEGGVFQNVGKTRLNGVELEAEQVLNARWSMEGNLSFLKAIDKTTDTELVGSSTWMGNLIVKGKLMPNLLMTTRYRFYTDRYREAEDTRDSLNGAHIVDFTLNRSRLFMEGLTLRAGIKNVFDAEAKSFAPLGSYVDDLPRPGRTWWFQVAYDL